MPELPEVETVRRGLAPTMEGGRIERLDLARPDLRFPFAPDFAEQLTGQRISALWRRAKYLLLETESQHVVIMHLGMSGSFRIENDSAALAPGTFHHERSRLAAHDHVTFHLTDAEGATYRVVYNDPRRFGFMLLTTRAELEQHPMLRDLGAEPLGNSVNADDLAARFHGKTTPLKSALLDQKIIAGLGNIYVCEALWRSRLSPRRHAGTLVRKNRAPTDRLRTLLNNVRDVLGEAIDAGGSSLRDHAATDGSLGYFQHRFAVYDREGETCQRDGCSATVKRIVQSGRSTFYCPVCQR